MWTDEDRNKTLETLKQARADLQHEMVGFNQPGADDHDRDVFYKIGSVLIRLNKAIDSLAFNLYGEDAEDHN
jgi:hypothetical protein